MKPIAFVTVAALSLVALAAPTYAKPSKASFAKCADAILSGRDSRNERSVKLGDHDFTCKPASVQHIGKGTYQVKGQLSHQLRFRPDDQFYYTLKVSVCNGGRHVDLDVKVNRGGFAPVPGAIGRMIGKRDWETEWRKAGEVWDGDWREASSAMIWYLSDNFIDLKNMGAYAISLKCEPQTSARIVRPTVRDHRKVVVRDHRNK